MKNYFDIVCKLGKVKYELDEEVLQAYTEVIQECEANGFTPRRTIEYVAAIIF